MQNPRELLVLLFALFWASSLAAAARYRGFPTASLCNLWQEPGGRLKRLGRLLVSTLFLNILPVFQLWALWEWAIIPSDKWQDLPPDAHYRRLWGFAGASAAALSVFAMIRLYHAIVASKETIRFFYAPYELKAYGTSMQGTNEPERPLLTHFLPGIGYLVWWIGIAWGIKEYLAS